MRRTILRILGISLAAAALVSYVNWAGDRDAAAPDPSRRLQCADRSRIAAAQASTAPTAKETRTPEELAAAWAKARSPELLAGQHRVYSDDDRVDIGFDRKAQTVAVLTFRAYGQLGWHLDAVVACG